MKQTSVLKNYSDNLLLLAGIIVGSLLGLVLGEKISIIKPLGDIFLNLLFTAIIPLIFFLVSSSVAELNQGSKIGKLTGVVIGVFIGTVIIASLVMVFVMMIIPLDPIVLNKEFKDALTTDSLGSQITQLLTVSDFQELLSRKKMLAIIIFSFLVGFATLKSGEKGKNFALFLNSGNEVMKKLLHFIMKIAPVGLGSYFACQVASFGPGLFGVYGKPVGVYYVISLLYFIIFYSLYAFFSGDKNTIKIFWKNNITPALTALGTCSSIASIPANLEASEKINVPEYIRNVVMPIGGAIHKEGTAMLGILKIAVLFSVFGRDFTDPYTILIAIGIVILLSIVEGGIPGGGYIGDLFIITVYGFPVEQALPVVMILSTLVDPPATLLNANGDVISAMLSARIAEGKKWWEKTKNIF